MTATKEAPYYQYGEWQTNSTAFQVSQLVQSEVDVRRLLVPIHEWSHLCEKGLIAEELEQLVRTWEERAFLDHADRAQEILDELDDFWTNCTAVDMMELGERRVPLHALSYAIAQHCEQLKQAN